MSHISSNPFQKPIIYLIQVEKHKLITKQCRIAGYMGTIVVLMQISLRNVTHILLATYSVIPST
jgi:hypothetical protein